MLRAGGYREVTTEEEHSKQRRKERKREKSSAQTTFFFLCLDFFFPICLQGRLSAGSLIHSAHAHTCLPGPRQVSLRWGEVALALSPVRLGSL